MTVNLRPLLRVTVIAGGTAALAVGLGLGSGAAALGQSFLAPLNASSQWLLGPAAAAGKALQADATGAGLATHVAACLFWALMLALAAQLLRLRRPGELMALGLATCAVAGVVDYGLLPRSLSPGWHLVLPPAGVAAGFLAMGLGLGLGAILARPSQLRAI